MEILLNRLIKAKERLDDKEPLYGKEYKEISILMGDTPFAQEQIRIKSQQIPDDVLIVRKVRKQVSKVIGLVIKKEKLKGWKKKLPFV